MPQHENYYWRVVKRGAPEAWSDTRWWGAIIVSIALPAAVYYWPALVRPYEKIGWVLLVAIFLLLTVLHLAKAQMGVDQEQISEIERLKALLESHTDHRLLSKQLTSKHRYANHEFLNRLPQSVDEVNKWDAAVHEWRLEIEAIMKRHGCLDEEFSHVDTINVLEMDHYMLQPQYRGRHRGVAMLRIRLDRIADISRDHLREAERLANLR